MSAWAWPTLLGNFQVFALATYGALLLGEHGGWRLWAGLSLAIAGLALMLVPGWAGFDERFHSACGSASAPARRMRDS